MAIDYDGGLTCSMGVADLDRSIAWYQDVLGFTLLYRVDEIAWCELSTGVAKVNVGLGVSARKPGGKGGSTLTFGVTDIEAAKAELDRHGVRQDGADPRYSRHGPAAHLLRSRRQCADVLPGSERGPWLGRWLAPRCCWRWRRRRPSPSRRRTPHADRRARLADRQLARAPARCSAMRARRRSRSARCSAAASSSSAIAPAPFEGPRLLSAPSAADRWQAQLVRQSRRRLPDRRAMAGAGADLRMGRRGDRAGPHHLSPRRRRPARRSPIPCAGRTAAIATSPATS